MKKKNVKYHEDKIYAAIAEMYRETSPEQTIEFLCEFIAAGARTASNTEAAAKNFVEKFIEKVGIDCSSRKIGWKGWHNVSIASEKKVGSDEIED